MKKHSIKLRVRYAETDQMGVVYYANYLVWFEVARTEFFRVMGVGYREMEERDKIYVPVVESFCRYKSPLRYDDLVTVDTSLAEMSATRMSFDYEVSANGKTAAVGRTKHAFINCKGKPIPAPSHVLKAFS